MTDVHLAAGSYAVDALSPGERLEFEGHLAGCAGCRREVAEFADTLAELSPLAMAVPPASLRASVMAAVTGAQVPGRRLAATNGAAAGVGGDGPDVAPRRALPTQVTELRPLGPDEVVPLEEHPSVLPVQPWLDVPADLSKDLGGRTRKQGRDWLLGAVVAAALVVALVLSGVVYVSWERSQARVVQVQRENELFTAPDAEFYRDKISDGTRVSFVVSRERNEALFFANDLPDPETGRTYQLWVVGAGNPTPAGLVRDGGDVRQWIRLPENGDGLALSSEPAPRGSTTPTVELARVTIESS